MTYQDFEKYLQDLNQKFELNKKRSLTNEARAHNAAIICLVLDKSAQVNIFCGEMSIFRNNFYTHINNEPNREDKLGDRIKERVIAKLKDFINKENRKLNIIIESDNFKCCDDLIDDNVFFKGIREKKIVIKRLNHNVIMSQLVSHFVYSDTGISRIENNKKNHSGICSMNISESFKETLDKNFHSLDLASTLLPL